MKRALEAEQKVAHFSPLFFRCSPLVYRLSLPSPCLLSFLVALLASPITLVSLPLSSTPSRFLLLPFTPSLVYPFPLRLHPCFPPFLAHPFPLHLRPCFPPFLAHPFPLHLHPCLPSFLLHLPHFGSPFPCAFTLACPLFRCTVILIALVSPLLFLDSCAPTRKYTKLYF
jgi:hypothetical protein